jgi:hypothetical protein
MSKTTHFLLPFALACGLAAAAIPAAHPALDWTHDTLLDAMKIATETSGMERPATRLLDGRVRKTVAALDEPARLALVREAAPRVKAIIMSETFRAAHDAWLRQAHNAVRHGSAPGPAAAADVNSMQRQLAGQMYATYSAMPVEAIRMMLPGEIESHRENLQSSDNATDRARNQDLLNRAKAIEGLLASDPEKARKAYGIMKSVEAGGPADEGALTAASNESAFAAQPANYDRMNRNAVLARALDEFIRTAASVDFAAQTAQRANRTVFVNPAHEAQSWQWKMIYRFGASPAREALAFARQWRKEL